MNDIILDELRLNFKDIEKEIFGIVCVAGLSTIKLMLEKLDNELLDKRDKKRYSTTFYTKKCVV